MHNHYAGHWLKKLLSLLVWIFGLAFLWGGWRSEMVWGHDPSFYAWNVVVLSLMALMAKHWGGYGWHGKMMDSKMCSHQPGCKCGDCPKCM